MEHATTVQTHYLLQRLPIGLVWLDADFRVRGYSPEAAALLGGERLQACLGQAIVNFHPEPARSKVQWLLDQARQGITQPAMLINLPDKLLQLRISRVADGLPGEAAHFALLFYEMASPAFDETSHEPEVLEPAAANPEPVLVKLPVAAQGGIVLMDLSQVAYLRAEGHHTLAWVAGRNHFCSLSLSQLAVRLPDSHFLRVHRSYIVNLAHAGAVTRQDDQYRIVLSGAAEEKIPVSRAHVPVLRRRLGV